MIRKTLDEKNFEEESIMPNGFFMETSGLFDIESKMRTFHIKHDKKTNYNCLKCKTKISTRNKDWHNGTCDSCFNKEFFSED